MEESPDSGQAGVPDSGTAIPKAQFIEAVSAELLEHFNGVECARLSSAEADLLAACAFQRAAGLSLSAKRERGQRSGGQPEHS